MEVYFINTDSVVLERQGGLTALVIISTEGKASRYGLSVSIPFWRITSVVAGVINSARPSGIVFEARALWARMM